MTSHSAHVSCHPNSQVNLIKSLLPVSYRLASTELLHLPKTRAIAGLVRLGAFFELEANQRPQTRPPSNPTRGFRMMLPKSLLGTLGHARGFFQTRKDFLQCGFFERAYPDRPDFLTQMFICISFRSLFHSAGTTILFYALSIIQLLPRCFKFRQSLCFIPRIYCL